MEMVQKFNNSRHHSKFTLYGNGKSRLSNQRWVWRNKLWFVCEVCWHHFYSNLYRWVPPKSDSHGLCAALKLLPSQRMEQTRLFHSGNKHHRVLFYGFSWRFIDPHATPLKTNPVNQGSKKPAFSHLIAYSIVCRLSKRLLFPKFRFLNLCRAWNTPFLRTLISSMSGNSWSDLPYRWIRAVLATAWRR